MEIKLLDGKYKEYEGQQVELFGWIRNKRNGKNISFLNINDGTCFKTVQVVYKKLSNQDEIEKSHLGAGLKIVGNIVISDNEKQPYEVKAISIEVLAPSKEDYPLQPKKHTYEFLREIAHLRARTNTFNAVFRIRSVLSYAIHDYFNREGFLMVHSPIITSSDAEGAGEMFQLTTLDLEKDIPKDDEGNVNYKKDFFGKKASLTVTGQLQAEAFALAFNKIYTFGPTFRAENSNTTRHAAEFWMLEPEISFANLDDLIELAKNMLIYVVDYVLKNAPDELNFLNQVKGEDVDIIERLEQLVNANFTRITYASAVEQLESIVASGYKFENEVYFGVDLATEHEKYLTDVIYKSPVFVTDYPKEIKAFYMRNNDDGKTVAACDLLVPGIGELIGGSQREERIDVLIDKMKEHNLDPKEYEWYIKIREYGGVDHAGFGLGFERLIMYVTGMENIRDVIPFPRTTRSCEF